MRFTRKYFASLFIVIITLSCNSLDSGPEAVWLFASTEGEGKKDTLLNAASFLNLQKDGSYSRDFGFYDYGKWAIEQNELILNSARMSKVRIPIKKQGKNELQLSASAELLVNFVRTPAADNEANPFVPEHNQWRLAAQKHENTAELRNRLLNHCRFWELYFSWGLHNNINALDVRNTPTPIKIYANGFGLKKYNDLPQSWKRYFYDSTNCKQASDMLISVFSRHKIKWPETDSKYEMFISAFQQLQQHLKEIE